MGMTEEQLLAEIQQLEEEIKELENGKVDLVAMVREQFENVDDDLLVDIINADTQTEDRTASQRTEMVGLILEENVHRFNGITLFPVSADKEGAYLGVRFDTFDTASKRFNPAHYVILYRRETTRKGDTGDSGGWKWFVFQSTLPPGVNVGRYEQEYLFEEHHEEPELTGTVVPGLNMVNKFAMRVYDELV